MAAAEVKLVKFSKNGLPICLELTRVPGWYAEDQMGKIQHIFQIAVGNIKKFHPGVPQPCKRHLDQPGHPCSIAVGAAVKKTDFNHETHTITGTRRNSFA